VKSVLFTDQQCLPLIPEGGSIILNAPIVGSKGLPANSIYSATKVAIRSSHGHGRLALKDRKIRVNAVSPGSTDTTGLRHLLGSSEVGRERLKKISSSVPMGRLNHPSEVARAVVFLASNGAGYITGSELFVDGGFAQV
jgi:NAD(P)-dependent dehydrogenase (short-subunit alcohol dehydrogenase family)